MSSRSVKEFLNRASEVDKDVTITVVDENGMQLVTCIGHKVILSAWSIVFQNLFEIERQEDVKFKLPTLQPEVLEQIFSWMYTQEFRVSDESLPALLKIADYLLIEPLVEDIIAYLKKILSEQNWLTIWRACQAENVPSGLLDDIVTKCLIENHRDNLGFPELTPDEQELISAMQGYITVFLDSERNLRKFKFLVSVWEFVVGHSHGQQMQEILDKLLQDVVGVARG